MKNTDKARFMKALSVSSISKLDTETLRFASDYFDRKTDPRISTRMFLFFGPTGVGKTYLAERLASAIGRNTIYFGTGFSNVAEQCKSLKQVASKVSEPGEAVVLIDDIAYRFERGDFEITSEDKSLFMEILDVIKKDSSKILIMTVNDISGIDEQMMDRIEAKIGFDAPSEKAKIEFLNEKYQGILSSKCSAFLSRNTFGYNFRDISEVIKVAYQIKKGKIEEDAVSKAIKSYKPTRMQDFDVENSIKMNLSDIIGKKEAMYAAKKLIISRKKPRVAEKLGLEMNNRLLFYGPPGSGKTFTAKAIAGELGYPLLKLNCRNANPIKIFDMLSIAKRYRECVIFFDEADKIFGGGRFEEDGASVGFFNSLIDDVEENSVKSVIIIAVNEPERFGSAFRDRFTEVGFGFPEKQERFEYFQKKAAKAGISADFDVLSERTEGFTFRDLERIWAELMFQHVEKGRIDEGTALGKFNVESNPDRMFG